MKKLLLLLPLLIILYSQDTKAVCCPNGCFPNSNVCGSDGNGYVGCSYNNQNYPPGASPEGATGCAICQCTSETSCSWVAQNSVCNVIYPTGGSTCQIAQESGTLQSSSCSCPSGYLCTDGSCMPLNCDDHRGTIRCSESQPCSQGNCIDGTCQIAIVEAGQSCQGEGGVGGLCCDEYIPTQPGFILDDTSSTYIGEFECVGDYGCRIGRPGEAACNFMDGTDLASSNVVVSHEKGPCKDGMMTITRIVKERDPVTNQLVEKKDREEFQTPCSSLPIIPFYTSINIIITLLILTIFYFFRKSGPEGI